VSLTAKDVAEITRLLEESAFDELDLEFDGLKLSLRRGAHGDARPLSAGPTAAATAPNSAPAVGAAPAASPAASSAAPPGGGPGVRDVLAPLLGTFYRAAKPGAPPFIEVGARVEAETIIGIIEVMKLMNTVRAGMRGTVTEILGRDGALVEHGETLLRVDPAN
jgi:acetyl-CoA carboxylase biotin carboxyl carrier protein